MSSAHLHVAAVAAARDHEHLVRVRMRVRIRVRVGGRVRARDHEHLVRVRAGVRIRVRAGVRIRARVGGRVRARDHEHPGAGVVPPEQDARERLPRQTVRVRVRCLLVCVAYGWLRRWGLPAWGWSPVWHGGAYLPFRSTSGTISYATSTPAPGDQGQG